MRDLLDTTLQPLGTSSADTPYRMCVRTVMDTTDPEIVFDEDGVSNHWLAYQRAIDASPALAADAAEQRARIIQEIKNERGSAEYDCVLGLSGGVDSSYLAHLAVEAGLNPLVVHFDNGWNSELAVSNIERLVKGLGLDLHTFVMDWPEFRDLQRAYFRASVVDLEVPTDHMILGALYRIATKHGIKVLLSGTNVATETILPRRWYFPKFDLVNLRAIHKEFGTLPLKKLPSMGFWQMIYYSSIRGIREVRLLDYAPYDKQAAKALLGERYGWRDYGGKHYESVFTRFYQGYILPRKFNIDKRKAHLSNVICAGQLSRDSALEELGRPTYDPELQEQDRLYVAKKLGFTDDEFTQILQLPNRRHEEFGTDTGLRRRYYRFLEMILPYRSLFRRKAVAAK